MIVSKVVHCLEEDRQYQEEAKKRDLKRKERYFLLWNFKETSITFLVKDGNFYTIPLQLEH